jgi:GNAT superfamily N-acetyltransferase
MDRAEILALYDREMRADPPDSPGATYERGAHLVREVGGSETIVFAQLTSETAGPAVLAEAQRSRSLGRELEWKVYDHDAPPGLARLLEEAGFQPDEPETLVARDLQLLGPSPPSGGSVEVREVRDERGLDDAVAVSLESFGPKGAVTMEKFRGRLDDPTARLFVAYAEGRPVSVGRLELPPHRTFASLWGGGTVPEFRRRGIYRALVRARADMAKARGYRFLTVDARETSRPILERLGFVPLTGVRGWVLTPSKTGPAGGAGGTAGDGVRPD